jgi:hypothetical protein
MQIPKERGERERWEPDTIITLAGKHQSVSKFIRIVVQVVGLTTRRNAKLLRTLQSLTSLSRSSHETAATIFQNRLTWGNFGQLGDEPPTGK